MPRFIVCIAFVVLATACLLAGRASAAAGNPCSNSGFYTDIPDLNNAVWRMEVLIDEAAYAGPSMHDRLNHNWNQTAKRTYRWTSTAMPIDTGTSTELMTVSAALIGKGVPPLQQGDIVDVAMVQGFDYSKGRAPVIVRRVCAARDEGCVDGLRRMQDGRVSGVAVGGGYQVACYRGVLQPLANRCRALQKVGCSGDVAAALK